MLMVSNIISTPERHIAQPKTFTSGEKTKTAVNALVRFRSVRTAIAKRALIEGYDLSPELREKHIKRMATARANDIADLLMMPPKESTELDERGVSYRKAPHALALSGDEMSILIDGLERKGDINTKISRINTVITAVGIRLGIISIVSPIVFWSLDKAILSTAIIAISAWVLFGLNGIERHLSKRLGKIMKKLWLDEKSQLPDEIKKRVCDYGTIRRTYIEMLEEGLDVTRSITKRERLPEYKR